MDVSCYIITVWPRINAANHMHTSRKAYGDVYNPSCSHGYTTNYLIEISWVLIITLFTASCNKLFILASQIA